MSGAPLRCAIGCCAQCDEERAKEYYIGCGGKRTSPSVAVPQRLSARTREFLKCLALVVLTVFLAIGNGQSYAYGNDGARWFCILAGTVVETALTFRLLDLCRRAFPETP